MYALTASLNVIPVSALMKRRYSRAIASCKGTKPTASFGDHLPYTSSPTNRRNSKTWRPGLSYQNVDARFEDLQEQQQVGRGRSALPFLPRQFLRTRR